MPTRLRHALRFALTTLAAVYAVGVAWVLADAYLLGAVAVGPEASEMVRFNEFIWRQLAGALAVVVFLLRLSDVHVAPPGWLYAWLTALWLAAASVAVSAAIQTRHFTAAAVAAALAVVLWLGFHRRVPGWPGRASLGDASGDALDLAPGAAASERDLHRLR